jgi:hypothetical protein
VSCDDDGEWDLEIILEEGLEYGSILKEKINARTLTNGWKEIKYDISKYAGMEMEIVIKQTAGGISKSHAYWHNIKIVSE